jgi:hypothetical protein
MPTLLTNWWKTKKQILGYLSTWFMLKKFSKFLDGPKLNETFVCCVYVICINGVIFFFSCSYRNLHFHAEVDDLEALHSPTTF